MTKSKSLYSQSSETIIFQAQELQQHNKQKTLLPQHFELDLRKERFKVDRDLLYLLPDSMFYFIFPDGLQQQQQQTNVQSIDDAMKNIDLTDTNYSNKYDTSDSNKIIYIDFDPSCFEYIITFYQQRQRLSLKSKKQGKEVEEEEEIITYMINNMKKKKNSSNNNLSSSVLFSFMTKQVIIILREELDYYVLPFHHHQQQNEKSKKSIQSLKYEAGKRLVSDNNIFDPLIKNIKKENNIAEQHLVDMLCDAGFSISTPWAYRNLEPKKTCILSLSLVQMNIPNIDQKLAIAQKLLLFWKKPARKCWWDMDEILLDDIQIRLWKRRTWTLELSMV